MGSGWLPSPDGSFDPNTHQYCGPETSGSTTTVPYGTRTDDNDSLVFAILETIAEWEADAAALRTEANILDAHGRLLADILYPENLGGNQ